MTPELPLPIPLKDWLKEREANCLRIAKTKTGADKAGWLEDARYFSECIEQLCRSSPAADEAAREIVGAFRTGLMFHRFYQVGMNDALERSVDGIAAIIRKHSAVSPKAGQGQENDNG